MLESLVVLWAQQWLWKFLAIDADHLMILSTKTTHNLSKVIVKSSRTADLKMNVTVRNTCTFTGQL